MFFPKPTSNLLTGFIIFQIGWLISERFLFGVSAAKINNKSNTMQSFILDLTGATS